MKKQWVFIALFLSHTVLYASEFDDQVVRERAKLSEGEANEYISLEFNYDDTRRMTNKSRDGETEHYGEFELDTPRKGRDSVVIKIDVNSDIESRGDCVSIGTVEVDGVSIRKLTLDVEFENVTHYSRDSCIDIGNVKGAQHINEVDVIINGEKIRTR